MKNKAENLDSIPNDLINEIFSRLPAKSVGKFRCVSKLWCSMLHRPYFTELFLTRSSARPRLLFALEGRGGMWRFFSPTQPQNPYEKSSSLVVDTDVKLHRSIMRTSCCRDNGARLLCNYTSGLMHFSHVCRSTLHKDTVHEICNPVTGQHASLPKLRSYGHTNPRISFLGFDPIDKQFKVLSMAFPSSAGNEILTVGTGNESWRKIHCTINHIPLHGSEKVICINGILYYLARLIIQVFDANGEMISMLGYASLLIVCFDVRSEEFKFIDAEGVCDPSAKLINYKGKLGGILWSEGIGIELFVLKDVEKIWSKYIYFFGDDKVDDRSSVYFAGMTATGEIVLSMKNTYTSKPFYVFYLNLEENTIQSVEIKGLVEEHGNGRVYAFVDHVEDFSLIDAKLFKSRPKPQHREEVREKDRDWRYDDGVSIEKKRRRE